jgi:nickel transport protein
MDKNKMPKQLILCIILIASIGTESSAHDVSIEITKNYPSVILRASYFQAEPLAYARVMIFSPVNDVVEYQNGRTDKSGYFAFVPDSKGDWKITVDDEMGHFTESIVTITDDFFTLEGTAAVVAHTNRRSSIGDLQPMYKILFGLALLFGITGIFYWFKAKQALQTKPDKH